MDLTFPARCPCALLAIAGLALPAAAQPAQPAPVIACFAPGTSPDYVERISSLLDARNRLLFGTDYYTLNRWPGSTGTPIALTWSLVPDGLSIPSGAMEPVSPSNLFAQMDAAFASQGGRATWVMRIQQVFNRWAAVTGNTYTRIRYNGADWDDGAAWGQASAPGLRGDIRIGMHSIDGPSNTLAYNYFPNSGDMVLDSADTSFFATTTNQNRNFRNVLAHEHGHGLGLKHTCSADSDILMEPLVGTSFDGPQQDDLRGINSLYGDPFEPDNTPPAAHALGTLAQGAPIALGSLPVPLTGQNDPNAALLSIHGDGDADWYAFTIGGALQLTATATPIGSTYDGTAQAANGSCPAGTVVNGLAAADLVLTVYSSNGTTVLATANSTGAGLAETANVSLPAAGAYFVKVSEAGSPLGDQLYRLDLSGVCASAPSISQQPGSRSVVAGANTTFNVTATNATSYQWRKNGAPLSDGGHILGSATAALHIGPASMADEGTYTVRISSPCAITTSTPATLTVLCYANCDGSTAAPVLNVDDFVCFINLYTAGDAQANCDGSTAPPILNILDILCFHQAYQAGCP